MVPLNLYTFLISIDTHCLLGIKPIFPMKEYQNILFKSVWWIQQFTICSYKLKVKCHKDNYTVKKDIQSKRQKDGISRRKSSKLQYYILLLHLDNSRTSNHSNKFCKKNSHKDIILPCQISVSNGTFSKTRASG